jgi:hypothetical protein
MENTNIIKNDKIVDKHKELKSAKIKNQLYEDCWAHAISRNFVRTFQILDVIKSEYVE